MYHHSDDIFILGSNLSSVMTNSDNYIHHDEFRQKTNSDESAFFFLSSVMTNSDNYIHHDEFCKFRQKCFYYNGLNLSSVMTNSDNYACNNATIVCISHFSEFVITDDKFRLALNLSSLMTNSD